VKRLNDEARRKAIAEGKDPDSIEGTTGTAQGTVDSGSIDAPSFNPDDFSEEDFEEVRVNADEVEYGTFLKLENVGDCIVGWYEQARNMKSSIAKREQRIYDLRVDGALWSITGNNNMNLQMEPIAVGSYIRITLIGFDTKLREDWNPGKKYKVEVNHKKTAEGGNPSGVKAKPSPVRRNPKFDTGK
jgi:hypothetical protein